MDTIVPALSLREDKEYFYKIIEAVPANIFWKDIYGRYLGCNKRVLKLAGVDSLADFIGKTDFDFPWVHHAQDLKKTDQKVIRNKKTINLHEEVLFNGKKRYYFSSKTPLFDDQNPEEVIGVIGVAIDITKQTLAEKRIKIAQEKVKLAHKKIEFEKEFRESTVILAGSIAHDLKNPLSGIQIYSDLIKNALEKVSRPAETKHVEEIKQELAEMRHLFSNIQLWNNKIRKNMNDMSAFINTTMSSISRLLTDSLTEADYTLCEIEPCLRDIIDLYPFNLDEKESIHLNITRNFEFLGSPVLFYRVIANLINNALRQIQLQKQGEIYITIDETVTHNLVKIKDTAGNIAADKIKNIFSTYKDKSHQNTGIGLKFCKITMQSFGGDITCDVVDGQYIEFTLHFIKV